MIDTIETWHKVLETKDLNLLDSLLADDAVMISPVVHTFQRGKGITRKYLSAASHVLGNEHFKYLAEYRGERGVVFEFETELDGTHINGVDIISWNDEGQITEFKVMLRPLQAVNKVHAMMGEMLSKLPNG